MRRKNRRRQMMGARYHGKNQKTTYDNQQDPNTSNTARNELGN
jgi:hypothetical protein